MHSYSKKIIILISIFILLSITCNVVSAATVKPICTNIKDQKDPAIYGNKVVWTDSRNGNKDIYMKDLSSGKEIPVSVAPYEQKFPKIYQNIVVWQDLRDYKGEPIHDEIYMKDLSTGKETRITNNKNYDYDPQIYGTKIVYTRALSSPGYGIFVYDIKTKKESLICINKDARHSCDIYNNIVVWADARNYPKGSIYMKNLAASPSSEVLIKTNIDLTKTFVEVIDANIQGNKIVWTNREPGSTINRVHIYDISTKKTTILPLNPKIISQGIPDIYGNTLVWQDITKLNMSKWTSEGYLCLKNLATGKLTILDLPGNQNSPNIYGETVVWVDDRNGNYDIYGLFPTTPTQDLTLTSLLGPNSSMVGKTLKISSSIKNQGNSSITKSFQVKYYLSRDSVLSSTDYLLTTRTITSLGAGKTISYTIYPTISSNLSIGTYYLMAMVDTTKVIAESKESNNIRVGNKITLNKIFKDLIVMGLASPLSVFRGASLKVTETVMNQGNLAITKPFLMKYYLSRDKNLSSTDYLIGYRTINSLGAGQKTTSSKYCPINSIPANNYYLIGRVDANKQVVESNEFNNIKVGNQVIVKNKIKDLIITNLTGSSTVYRGNSIKITDTVKNQGNLAISNSFIVKYYLSVDSNITSTDYLIGQRTISSLGTGSTNTHTSTFTVPHTVLPRSYYLGAKVDSNNQVAESNETNNMKTANLVNVKNPETNIAICTKAGDQSSPSVYGDKIVWMDTRNGNYDIYMYNTTTKQESAVYVGPGNQQTPKIYGNIVVWWDRRNDTMGDIYMKDISTSNPAVAICALPSTGQVFPFLYQKKIFWSDSRNGGFDIYMYDLNNPTPNGVALTKSHSVYGSGSVYKNTLVYADYSSGILQVYRMDITQKKPLKITSSNTTRQEAPHIYGNRVVWIDFRNNSLKGNIYMKDLGSAAPETRISPSGRGQYSPKIYNNLIVWEDERNTGGVDIYMKDLSNGKETQITRGNLDQHSPEIYEKTIVWFDERSGNQDIYMTRIV
jgi:beta propeller repeat protein